MTGDGYGNGNGYGDGYGDGNRSFYGYAPLQCLEAYLNNAALVITK